MTWTERNTQRIAEAHAMRREMWTVLLDSARVRSQMTSDWLGPPVEPMVVRHQPPEARRATSADIQLWKKTVLAAKRGAATATIVDDCTALDKDDRLTYLAFKLVGGRGRVPRKAEKAQREWMRLRAEIVADNERLIRLIATRFAPPDMSQEDAWDAGQRGATKAVDRYDASRGAYSKVAALWIQHEVTRRDGSRKYVPPIVPLHEVPGLSYETGYADSSNTLAPVSRGSLKALGYVQESLQHTHDRVTGHESPVRARLLLAELLAELPTRVRKSLFQMNETRPDKKTEAVLAGLRTRLEACGIHCVEDLLA